MNDKNSKPADEFMERAAEISMEWFDIEPIARALFNEYQRGVADGKASAPQIDPDQLKAEYERGRESYRDELLAKMIPTALTVGQLDKFASQPVTHDDNHKPVAKPAEKDVGGRPSAVGRPDGIPRNLDMALEAIKELGGKAAAPQILAYVRKKWWSNCADHWTSNLHDFAKQKKLARDGINFVAPLPKLAHVEIDEASGVDTQTAARIAEIESKPRVLPRGLVRAPMPPVQPTAGKRPLASGVIKFEHGDRSTILSSTREYTIAGKLRAAMGSGHVAEAFLAERVIGSNTEHNRAMIKDICLGMNPALADVGLKIEHYPGFGLLMKEA
jgi:hypothetical protein